MMKKKFDCVEMKRECQRKIYALTKDMTPEEEVAFFHEQSEDFRRRLAEAKKQARQHAE